MTKQVQQSRELVLKEIMQSQGVTRCDKNKSLFHFERARGIWFISVF
ncbi:TPA: hypothetical protein ACIOY4_001472 [Streptococcus agalactiae]